MPEIEITKDEARTLLAEVVAEKGRDYVYPRANSGDGCVYFESDGSPSCIVGHVLAKKGATLAQLEDLALNGHAVETLFHEGIVLADHATRGALTRAQDIQDGGSTWGTALNAANHVFDHPEEYVA